MAYESHDKIQWDLQVEPMVDWGQAFTRGALAGNEIRLRQAETENIMMDTERKMLELPGIADIEKAKVLKAQVEQTQAEMMLKGDYLQTKLDNENTKAAAEIAQMDQQTAASKQQVLAGEHLLKVGEFELKQKQSNLNLQADPVFQEAIGGITAGDTTSLKKSWQVLQQMPSEYKALPAWKDAVGSWNEASKNVSEYEEGANGLPGKTSTLFDLKSQGKLSDGRRQATPEEVSQDVARREYVNGQVKMNVHPEVAELNWIQTQKETQYKAAADKYIATSIRTFSDEMKNLGVSATDAQKTEMYIKHRANLRGGFEKFVKESNIDPEKVPVIKQYWDKQEAVFTAYNASLLLDTMMNREEVKNRMGIDQGNMGRYLAAQNVLYDRGAENTMDHNRHEVKSMLKEIELRLDDSSTTEDVRSSLITQHEALTGYRDAILAAKITGDENTRTSAFGKDSTFAKQMQNRTPAYQDGAKKAWEHAKWLKANEKTQWAGMDRLYDRSAHLEAMKKMYGDIRGIYDPIFSSYAGRIQTLTEDINEANGVINGAVTGGGPSKGASENSLGLNLNKR